LPPVAAGQRLGVGGRLELAAAATASSIAVDLAPGRPAPATLRPVLTTADAFWRQERGATRVIGVVANPTGQASGPVALTALGLDAQGRIVGAGSATADPVPANGRSPVEVPIVVALAPVEVELYATSK
jgi:hypothetical protein